MRFWLKQYLWGLSKRKSLFLYALIPPILYLLVAGILPYRYVIWQDISIAEEAPVAVPSSPIDFMRAAEAASRSEDLLADGFALRELERRLELPGGGEEARLRSLRNLVVQHLRLNNPSAETLRVLFEGEDRALGREIVTFFSDRLLRRAEEGRLRAQMVPLTQLNESGVRLDADSAELDGALQLEVIRRMWAPERGRLLLAVVLLSILAVLVWQAILEWADPSFRSERQVARYLGVPILGSVPDLNKTVRRLRSP